jgi:membrane protein implicated in regulation of membrane protease activity
VSASPPSERERYFETENLLIDGLRQGYRFSSEAVETMKSNYEDSLLLTLLLGLFVFAWGLMVSITSQEPLSPNSGSQALITAVLLSILVSVPASIVIRRMYRRDMAQVREWAGRFREAIDREMDGSVMEDDGRSAFGLLIDATPEIPRWLSVRRRSSVKAHPFLATAMFILGLSAAALFFSSSQINDGATRAAAVVGSVLLVAVCVAMYAWIQDKARRQYRAGIEEWHTRIATSRSEIENLLGKL